MTQHFDGLVDVLTGDRSPARWAGFFAEGAVVVDHSAPVPTAEAGEWLGSLLERVPCTTFSCEWRLIDGAAGAAWLWFHLPDPDEADIHYDAPHLLVARSADGGSLTELEIFGPLGTWRETVEDWLGAIGDAVMAPDPALHSARPSHPPPPEPPPDRAILEAVADAMVSENWLDLVAWGARWHDHAGHPIERWAGGRRTEHLRVLGGSRVVLVFEHELPAAIVVHVDETGRITYLDHLCDWTTAAAGHDA